MICPFCEQETPDGRTFCSKCGNSLETAYRDDRHMRPAGENHYNYGQGQGAGFGGGPMYGANQQEQGFRNGEENRTQNFENGYGDQDQGFGNGFGGGDGFSDFDSEPSSQFGQHFDDTDSVIMDNPGGWKKRSLPKPVLILIIIAFVFLILCVAAFTADHFGLFKLPFLSGKDDQAAAAVTAEGNTVSEDNGDAGEEVAEEPEKDGEETTGPTVDNSGQISISVTDIEPADMESFRQIDVQGIESADGVDGTAAVNMLNNDNSIWKVSKDTITSDEGSKIRLTFDKCKLRVIKIRAGNWASAEDYNNDGRPTKIYLSANGYEYPLTLNDEQKEHYIVLSHAYETEEILLTVDAISNNITGNCAITNISVYAE